MVRLVMTLLGLTLVFRKLARRTSSIAAGVVLSRIDSCTSWKSLY